MLVSHALQILSTPLLHIKLWIVEVDKFDACGSKTPFRKSGRTSWCNGNDAMVITLGIYHVQQSGRKVIYVSNQILPLSIMNLILISCDFIIKILDITIASYAITMIGAYVHLRACNISLGKKNSYSYILMFLTE